MTHPCNEPIVHAHCLSGEDDSVAVIPIPAGSLTDDASVGVALVEGGHKGAVHITPADARRIAAGLLNAADEADGTSPLPPWFDNDIVFAVLDAGRSVVELVRDEGEALALADELNEDPDEDDGHVVEEREVL